MENVGFIRAKPEELLTPFSYPSALNSGHDDDDYHDNHNDHD